MIFYLNLAIVNDQSTFAQNVKTQYQYNKLGNIQKVTYTDGIAHLFDYNPAGLLNQCHKSSQRSNLCL
jgi:YD repeat-containing protein